MLAWEEVVMQKYKDSREEVIASLKSHKLTLQRFRDRVNELKLGIGFRCQEGNRLYYSVDFSEIYSYLNYGDPDVQYFGVNISATGEGQIKSEQQHFLALTHLFQSFSATPLYLLQPYVLEMYSYARNQAHQLRKLEQTLSNLISSFTSQLKPEHKALLQAPDQVKEEQKIELLQVMKADYPKLSIDLLEFERWHTRNRELHTRGQLLKELLASRALSHRTDEILRECGIRDWELENPSLEEEKKVVDAFPPLPPDEEGRQFSRLVDARALLILRNMNRLLEGRNARLILITRDAKSPKVAERLEAESWFGWTDVTKYFYGIEAVYLDLILQPFTDEEKLEWLTKADSELSTMLLSVEQVLVESKADGSPCTPTEILPTTARDLLERNSQNWDQLVGVEFIRTSPVVEWLGKDFVTDRVLVASSHGEAGGQSRVSADESLLLKQLVTFVDSNDFQEVATKDANKLWEGIAADVFGMNSLGIFSDRLNDVLTQLKSLLPRKSEESELFRNVVANSRSFLNMPTVNFENRAYDEFVKNFRPWLYEKDQLINRLGQHLAELFSRAASNTEKPENCLFMAFVMGMLDYWDQAAEMAEHGRALIKKEKRSEFDYFLAFAKYRKVDMHVDDPEYALRQYISANANIRDALAANPYDARYLKRSGTISLQYHETKRRLARLGKTGEPHIAAADGSIVSEAEAIGFLKEAIRRAKNDGKIRVRALNNLAYTFGTSDPPRLKEAEECIKQIEAEFDAATKNPNNSLPDKEKWPFVMDTIWYIGAKIAYARRDANNLKRNLDLLKVALEKASLLEAEKRAIETHIREALEWQRELERHGDNAP
jgi:hypothetical protein